MEVLEGMLCMIIYVGVVMAGLTALFLYRRKPGTKTEIKTTNAFSDIETGLAEGPAEASVCTPLTPLISGGDSGDEYGGMSAQVSLTLSMGNLPAYMRADFIRKVYFILASQVGMTFFVSAAFMTVDSLKQFALNNSDLVLYGGLGVSLVGLICLFRFKKKYPLNWMFLIMFTLGESLMVGLVCAVYADAGLGLTVLEAFVLTISLFLGITMYALRS